MMLEKKNIVIIGGTTGIGLSAAKAFIANGAKVVVVGRNADSAEAAKKELGKNAVALSADAANENTAIQAIDICINNFGGFDGLYHVAGGSGRKMGDGPLHELTLDGWNKTMELNLTSIMLSNQAAVRKFLELSAGSSEKVTGTILNMGSVLGFSPSPTYFSTHAYAASKAAIIGFTKSIAAFNFLSGVVAAHPSREETNSAALAIAVFFKNSALDCFSFIVKHFIVNNNSYN